MRRPELLPATETFWERVSVALAAQGESVTTWADEAKASHNTFFAQRNNGQLPRPQHIDALCALTGCTREFLFNPEPVDLSK